MSNYPKEVLYLYPKDLKSNDYLKSTKRVWELGGYEVRSMPTNIFELTKIAKNKNGVIVFNWLEDRFGEVKNQYFVFLKLIILLIISKFIFKKIIWVRHNFRPHKKHSRSFFNLFIKIMNNLVDEVVTHRPVLEFSSTVIPHPLYEVDTSNISPVKQIPFLCFGAVEDYKGIDILLIHWPKNIDLYIAGKCRDKDLRHKIYKIVKERELSVIWLEGFIEYDELCQLIGRSKTVILPHLDREMIVSGAFYLAIALGANVMVRDGQFYLNYLKRFDFVTSFSNSNLEDAINLQSSMVANNDCSELNSEFSDELLLKKWGLVINGS